MPGLGVMRDQLLALAASAKALDLNADAAERIKSLMFKAMDGLARLPLGQQIANVKTWGEAGAESLEYLARGSQRVRQEMQRAADTGATTTKQQAADSKAWERSVKDLSMTWTGMKNIVGQGITVALMPELEKLGRWVDVNRDGLKSVFQAAAKEARIFAQVVEAAAKAWNAIHLPQETWIEWFNKIFGRTDAHTSGNTSKAPVGAPPVKESPWWTFTKYALGAWGDPVAPESVNRRINPPPPSIVPETPRAGTWWRSGAGTTAPAAPITSNITVNVTAAPGQDGNALGKQIADAVAVRWSKMLGPEKGKAVQEGL